MKTKPRSVETISIYQFLKRIPDEKAAREYIEGLIWVNGRYCPFCKSSNTVRVKDEKPMPYRCKDCRKHFSVRVGNIFESSKVKLHTWLAAIYLMTTAKKGVSSPQIARQLGITQKTAWMLCQKIREMWRVPIKAVLSGEVEVDEAYMGGTERNKHANKRLNSGRGIVGKQPVVGLRDRNNKVVGVVVEDTNMKVLHGLIRQAVRKGSHIYTDGHKGYHGLTDYQQSEVHHFEGEYVNNQVHTNGIESFWALLKRAYYGTFHHMSVKHMQRYVDEFAARQNMRGCDATDIIAIITKGAVGKSLPWNTLTHDPQTN